MDRERLERARAGDREAMEALLAELAPRVYRFGARMCRHPDDAEEVVQDTLLNVAQSLDQFEGRSSLSSWVYTLARTACARRRRGLKNQPMAPVDELGEPAAQGPSPERQVSVQQVADRVARALDELPDEQREVLVLRDMEGLTAPEAAEALGISVPAIKSRLHRARSALRERLPGLSEAPQGTPAAACPDVAEMLSKKLEGELDARACEAMEAHLDRCPACREGCEALQAALATCRKLGSEDAPLPPSLDQRVRQAVAAWVEGKKAPPP